MSYDNSQMTSLDIERELINFVQLAALDFAEHENHSTYGELTPGSYLGIRWGMDNDCVLVVKLDEYFNRRNYQQAVRKE